MQRKALELEPRYTLWQSIPETYRGHAEHRGPDLGPSFFEHFVSAFDAVLAPVHAAVEDFDLYLDPRTCPPDFLPWLGGWLDLSLNRRWPLPRRRDFVIRASEVFRQRGTLSGLAGILELFLGVPPEIADSGGATWSRVPSEALQAGSPSVTVTVPQEVDGRRVDVELVEQVATSFVPPFVGVTVRTL